MKKARNCTTTVTYYTYRYRDIHPSDFLEEIKK